VFDQDDLIQQVLHNCNIADSKHAGLYSICGLALRLRDLYKWEKGLAPWVERDSKEILSWIGEKEDVWDGLVENEFCEIRLMGHAYDPFDVQGINSVIKPHALFYSAGYVYSLRPTFFLAQLEERRNLNAHSVFTLGRELARDLQVFPALSQGNAIILRKEAAAFYLWDKIFFLKKSGRKSLEFALKKFGLDPNDSHALKANLNAISVIELETYLHHELGEIEDTVFDRGVWREMISEFPHTPIELYLRTIKDILADTNEKGTLRFIITEQRSGSLGLYVAFLDGLKKEILHGLIAAFEGFLETENWQLVTEAVQRGYEKAKKQAKMMTEIYRIGQEKMDMKWVQQEIEACVLAPLGLAKTKMETAPR
jgi:hypothetical protein